MVKEKYHGCDICYKENPTPGKNVIKFKYRKVEKVVSASMDICADCAEVFENMNKNLPKKDS
jgi:hypothetical protein